MRQVLRQREFNLHGLRLHVDPSNQHTWKTLYIGRIGEKNQLLPIYKSPEPIPPIAFPGARTRAEWDMFVDELYNPLGQQLGQSPQAFCTRSSQVSDSAKMVP